MIKIKDIKDEGVRATALSHSRNKDYNGLNLFISEDLGEEVFLSQAFYWGLTPEGSEYWLALDNNGGEVKP